MGYLLKLRHLPKFLAGFGRDRRGVSAIIFAISFAILVPVSLAVFDVYQSIEQRGRLQDALDSAALYAAKSSATDTPGVNTQGNKALAANLRLIRGAILQSSNFTLVSATGDTKIQATASVTLPAYAPLEYDHHPLTVTSEVTRPGNNLEIAMVLDNSASMAGASITSLRAAANQLIDLVVSDTQAPYYSKVAIIPYGNGVNVGGYAVQARGATQAGVNTAAGVNGAPPFDNFKFKNPAGGTVILAASTCVSERGGPEAYTDAAPSVALVGMNYPDTAHGNPCIAATMAPLSADKAALHASIANLSPCCSTAGHVGIAWGWYALSPNWSQLFTGDSAPAAYGAPHTIKAMILMTDGEYNSVYCKGVIAQDSTRGSGNAVGHINCNGKNGADPYQQAQSLCSAMKAAPNNVVVYTVGLNVFATPAAVDLVNKCASDASHVYLPATGADMQVAFQSIAADLNKLRISQ